MLLGFFVYRGKKTKKPQILTIYGFFYLQAPFGVRAS